MYYRRRAKPKSKSKPKAKHVPICKPKCSLRKNEGTALHQGHRHQAGQGPSHDESQRREVEQAQQPWHHDDKPQAEGLQGHKAGERQQAPLTPKIEQEQQQAGQCGPEQGQHQHWIPKAGEPQQREIVQAQQQPQQKEGGQIQHQQQHDEAKEPQYRSQQQDPIQPDAALVVVPGNLAPKRTQNDLKFLQSPTHLAERMLAAGLVPADAVGHRDGNWVQDATLFELLDFVCSQEARAQLTWQREAYDYQVVYLDSDTGQVLAADEEATGPPAQNQLLLVIHTLRATQGLHFSAIIINVRHKAVHAFDTLGASPSGRIAKIINGLYPQASLLRKHGFVIKNHTGKLRQQAATCGPWSLWICCAYALNFKGFRGAGDDLDVRKLQDNVLGFWKTVTA